MNAADFLRLDDDLDEVAIGIRNTVRAFAANELTPHIADWYDVGELPRSVFTDLGRLGVLGMHLDGYGCAGASAVAYGIACRELEAVDSGLRSLVSVQGSLAMFAIHHWGTDEQREHWLPALARGEKIGCFGLTEADAGSDPASMRTTARRDGRDWILTGSKMWITNGTVADVAVIWARTKNGIRGFAVPADSPGFTTAPIRRKLSLRASATAELVLDDVRVPDEAAFPEVRGLRGPLTCLNEARYGIAWGTVGAARTCLLEALRYTHGRQQFGRPLAAFQLSQRRLADMLIAVHNAGLVALQIGRLKDSGRLAPAHVNYAKLNNARSALDVARSARALIGAAGITLDHPVMRHLCNLESVVTYEGTEEMHTLSLGAEITGLHAFR